MIKHTPNVHITKDFGHPWDQRPGFDLMEIDTDSNSELNMLVEQANQEFWHTWISGKQGTKFSAALYQPSGIQQEWIDEPKQPFNATKEYKQ